MRRFTVLVPLAALLLAGCDSGVRRPGGPPSVGGGNGGATDSGTADAGTTGGADTGPDVRTDSGTPTPDSGTPRVDSGTPPFDGGTTTRPDSGAQGSVVRSVSAIQDPTHPDRPAMTCANLDGSGVVGTCARVELTGVVVTAIGAFVSTNLRGLWIQDPNDVDGRYAGIKVVYPTDSVLLSVGDVVDVVAEAINFRGGMQLQFATLSATGSRLNIIPVTVSSTQLGQTNPATHAYEGSLVRLDNPTVTTPCLVDTRDRDHGQWVVDNDVLMGSSFEYAYNGDRRPSEIQCFDANQVPTGMCGCNTPSGGSARPNDQRIVNDRFLALVGVVDFSFDAYQMQPRGDLDLIRTP